MRLSVIIVSYNVYPFLDNCLRSVRQALNGLVAEIIVVDNASVDRTPQLVQHHFPDVRLIANSDNVGFAKANNQGIKMASGEYILLLNPDTIVSEDTFSVCLAFMDDHPDAGALGVKMLDGSGQFLPESKRGLPTLLSSFLKMSGLYRLAPRSAKWNAYYQGHIGEDETARIDVLCGAFMCIRQSALLKTGLLDEDFFMYGEDIDLSYRITRAGYSIYYLPTTSIIHYKGESTRKSSLNYILTFYQAMLIFTRKHPEFKGQKSLIQLAIYFHGALQFLRQSISRLYPPVLDGLLIAGTFAGVSLLWQRYYFGHFDYFQPSFYRVNIPIYTGIFMLSMYLNGAYDRPVSRRASWLGFMYGVLIIFVVYALLPVELRTSRMVIILGSLTYLGLMLLVRTYVPPWHEAASVSAAQAGRRAIIIAGQDESSRIRELINRSRDQIEIAGTVFPQDDLSSVPTGFLGHMAHIEDILRVHRVKEIIFSALDVPFSVFTGYMSRLGPSYRYMLAASTTMNIVGSMNRDTEGESYAIRVHFNLSEEAPQRAKRLFDIMTSLCLILLFPFLMLILPRPILALRNILRVLSGKWTWVAYHPADRLVNTLPRLRPGIVYPAHPADDVDIDRRLQHIHYVYARDYHWTTDLSILTSQLKHIGHQPVTYGE